MNDYSELIEKLKEKASEDLYGYASDIIINDDVDGTYLIIINVVKLGEHNE